MLATDSKKGLAVNSGANFAVPLAGCTTGIKDQLAAQSADASLSATLVLEEGAAF